MLRLDANGDGKLERREITEQFTFPLGPELPLGHPGNGIPLPDDLAKRKERQEGIFAWVDKDKDGFWTRDEFLASMSSLRSKPMLIAIRGLVSVAKAGDTFQLVHQHDLGEPAYVTPALDATTTYFRTETNLCAFRTEG